MVNNAAYKTKYDSSTDSMCSLDTLGTVSCLYDYQVDITSHNSTISYYTAGSITVESECLSLTDLYTVSDNIWVWNTGIETIISNGYQIRDPASVFYLPSITNIALNSDSALTAANAFTAVKT